MTERPRRGEIWLVDLGQPLGHEAGYRRPALAVSDDEANRHGLIVVCPIGRAQRAYPTRVEVEAGATGLDVTSYVQCEQIRTIGAARLIHRLGVVDTATMFDIDRILRLVLRL